MPLQLLDSCFRRVALGVVVVVAVVVVALLTGRLVLEAKQSNREIGLHREVDGLARGI